MGRPIISDPNILGGAPHIDGTQTTVAEIKAFWDQPGVGAVATRARFPHLTEGELGAAVTWSEPRDPEFAFVADHAGPPHRRYHLWSDPPGWMFAHTEIDQDGTKHPGLDTWDESWEAILRYPAAQAPADLVWRDEKTGEVVDIYSLRFGP